MTEPRPVFAVVISAGLSAIPMVGGPLQTVFDAIEERTRHRAETTTREICESVGGADTVLSRIDKNPELEPLLSQAIEAATRTSMEAKRRLLAQAAAAALEDDQKVEPASLIVATLSQRARAYPCTRSAGQSRQVLTGPGRDPATRGDEGGE